MYSSKENFVTPLHLACSKNELTRPIMNYVHFKNGFAYASDGYVLVKQSLDDYCQVADKENLNGKMLHRDAFQRILKADKVTATESGVLCEFHKEKSTQHFNYGDCESKLPDFEMVMPKIEDRKEVSKIGLRPDKIEQACKCLYAGDSDYERKDNTFIFTFYEMSVTIEVMGNENQIALVMQCNLNK